MGGGSSRRYLKGKEVDVYWKEDVWPNIQINFEALKSMFCCYLD